MPKPFYTFVASMKNKIIHVGYDENGRKFTRTEKFKPLLATKTTDIQTHGFKTLHGDNVQFQRFDDINSYNEYTREYGDILDIYNNINPAFQFINQTYPDLTNLDLSKIRLFFIDLEAHSAPGQGFPEPKLALWPIRCLTIHDSITDNYYVPSLGSWEKTKEILIEKGIDLNKVKYYHCKSEKILFKYMVALFEKYKPDVLSGWNSEGFDIPYILNRASMIDFKEIDNLSPFGKTSVEWKELDNGNTQYNCSIMGVALIDYMKMYKKYRSANKESYKLDFILENEIGQNKVDYHKEGYTTFKDLWDRNEDLYLTYNIYDVAGMVHLEKKLKLFQTHYFITYKAKCNLENTMGTLTLWDVYLYNYMWDKKLIIPPRKNNEKVSYPGAFVKEPVPGIYDWLVSFDLNSLYPHIEMQWNISPETVVDDEDLLDECYYDELVDKKDYKASLSSMDFIDKEFETIVHRGEEVDGMIRVQGVHPNFLAGKIHGNKKYTLAANGHYFRKDKEGIIPELMRILYGERKIIKKSMLGHEQELEDYKNSGGEDINEVMRLESCVAYENAGQLGIKNLINSLYGALGQRFFRYYDLRCATAITLCGQLANKWCARYIEENMEKPYGIKIVYSDTDSWYFYIGEVVRRILKNKPQLNLPENRDKLIDTIDYFCKNKISPVIDQGYEDLKVYVNANINKMVAEREVISSCFHPNSIISDLNMSIENLYNSIDSNITFDGTNYMKDCSFNINSMNDKMEIENDEVYLVTKKKYSGYMYKFELDDKIIEVTSEHKLAVKNGNSFIWKMAKDITEEDVLILT